eukprot:gnl/Dysnectes_brevis/143_a168_10945.p1 GENE.gnl/Dysnectes_brevis/143_a168_10945~~gnl/Dysnectes_brevis/143_a168_10945.p1  ORF type:complete len:122 (+),score=22.74 gnl/Dysnectes_brevis/143_a168_10945:118-483(+)
MEEQLIRIQNEIKEKEKVYVSLQRDRSKLIELQHENTVVEQELKELGDDAKIYQVVGPVLVPKTMGDTKTSISDKLSFIKTQLSKIDVNMKKLEAEIMKINQARMKLQQQAQAAQAQAGKQ